MKLKIHFTNILVSLALLVGFSIPFTTPLLAAGVYSCDTYSAGAFGSGECEGQQSIGGRLSQTGRDALPFILLGLLLLAGGTTLLIINRKNRKNKKDE